MCEYRYIDLTLTYLHFFSLHLVARRNARERRRVQAVNNAFAKLRKAVPLENRNKRLSKVKTLQRAIEYIESLQDILQETGGTQDMHTSYSAAPSAWPTTPTSMVTSGSEISYSPSNASYLSHTDHNSSIERNMNINKENVIDSSDWLQIYTYSGQLSFHQNNY